jgi:two-component system chemotaxis response regulator CheB
MSLNVLIVDDSSFIQRVLKEIINDHPQLNVIGIASNGSEAVEKVKSLKPDLVTMDYEMPMMDGVTAVRIIMAENPLPILMLSSMTFSGAKITIDALEAGAADFMTKNFGEISAKGKAITKRLYDTLLALGESVLLSQQRSPSPPIQEFTSKTPMEKSACHPVSSLSADPDKIKESSRNSVKNTLYETPSSVKIVAIGASTGGPAALTLLLKKIPGDFPCPILIIQHMPQNFTLAFAQRLNKQCSIEVKEAEDGDKLIPGRALLAPGGQQLVIDKKDSTKIRIIDSTSDINYKPCVDISFASISNTYGKNTLAIVLTGMGNDGCNGARLLKEKKSTVWTQTEDSCVVYGMPMSVDKAQLSNASLSLDKMAYHLCKL